MSKYQNQCHVHVMLQGMKPQDHCYHVMNLWRFSAEKTDKWLQSGCQHRKHPNTKWLLMSPCVPHKYSRRIGSCHILPWRVQRGIWVTSISLRSNAWCIIQIPTSLGTFYPLGKPIITHPSRLCLAIPYHYSSRVTVAWDIPSLVGWDPKRRDRMDVGPGFWIRNNSE